MENRIYEVKKEQLLYSDFVSFIARAINDLITSEGISPIAKEFVFKYYFALYYLDIELDEDPVEAYDSICNINYKDYADKIAWTQFCDLRKAFEDKCNVVDKIVNKDISTAIVDLIEKINDIVSNMNDKMKNVDINEFMNSFGSLGDLLKQFDEKDVLEYAFNALTNKKTDDADNNNVGDDKKASEIEAIEAN